MKRMRHIGIVVRDLKKAIRFYKDIVGLRIEKEALESGEYIDTVLGLKGVSVRTVKMSFGDSNMIELLCFRLRTGNTVNRDICGRGYSHIAFTVDDVDLEYRQLRQKGIRFVSSPQVSPDGKARVVFCRDPEGNFIELVERLFGTFKEAR